MNSDGVDKQNVPNYLIPHNLSLQIQDKLFVKKKRSIWVNQIAADENHERRQTKQIIAQNIINVSANN
jgi:hypothetical protein